MAFTTEFTQAQVDQITRSIASGVREIEHNGKKTQFQSLEEMIALRDRMKIEIAAAAPSASSRVPFMTRRTVFIRC